MKTLIAIVTCHAPRYVDRANAQRETWAPGDGENYDVRFFLGRLPFSDHSLCKSWNEHTKNRPGEVWLDVDDSYAGLPAKVRAVCAWALANGYEALFKTDDDTYIIPELLLKACEVPRFDYVGNVRCATGGYPAPYASGFSYWLSTRAMQVISTAELTADASEDRWVGNVLAKHEIFPANDQYHYRYIAAHQDLQFIWLMPSVVGHSATYAEFNPVRMLKMHNLFRRWYPGYRKQVRKPKLKALCAGSLQS